MTTKYQPNLPGVLPYTEAELNFADEEPPRLFADNQNSNWGLHRRIFSNQMQEVNDQVTTLYNEMFVDTSNTFLDRHEYEVGLPLAPAGKTLQERRNIVKARIRTGPFTMQRLRDTIEAFIGATYGNAIQFDPAGIPFVSGGIPFFSGETGPLSSLYRIYVDYRTFTYEIWVKNTVGPDTVGLLRELNRITPGGITVVLDTTKADVLSYFRTVRNKQPVFYTRLDGNANDASGNGINGVLVGAPTAFANPGLLVNPAAEGSAAYTFNGTTQYVTVAHSALLDVGDNFSIEFWVKPTNFTGSPHIIGKGSEWDVVIDSSGIVYIQRWSDGAVVATASVALVAGTTNHVAITKKYNDCRIYINGVDRTIPDTMVAFANNTSQIVIARNANLSSGFLNGVLDEIALYDRFLTSIQVSEDYNTGRDIP